MPFGTSKNSDHAIAFAHPVLRLDLAARNRSGGGGDRIVGALAFVKAGAEFAPGQMIAGPPARGLRDLTGYDRAEAVGRNCRFLQGPDTDPAAIGAREVRVVEMLNYRKDGSAFWNALHVGPIYDEAGALTHFYGSQWDITDLAEKRSRLALQADVAEELHHRTKNLFAVISSIVSLSARGAGTVEELADKVRGRLAALGEAHAVSISQGRTKGAASDLYDLAATILHPYHEEGRDRVVLGGPVIRVPRDAVTPVGLMLHELATNALRYGALGAPEGTVTVTWSRRDDRLRLTWVEEGGPPTDPPETGGMGTHMMESVLRTIGADIRHEWPPTGLRATLDMGLDPRPAG